MYVYTHTYIYTHTHTDYIYRLYRHTYAYKHNVHICMHKNTYMSDNFHLPLKIHSREADLNELHFWAVLPSGFSQQEAPSEN